jgi:hypothetical protein
VYSRRKTSQHWKRFITNDTQTSESQWIGLLHHILSCKAIICVRPSWVGHVHILLCIVKTSQHWKRFITNNTHTIESQWISLSHHNLSCKAITCCAGTSWVRGTYLSIHLDMHNISTVSLYYWIWTTMRIPPCKLNTHAFSWMRRRNGRGSARNYRMYKEYRLPNRQSR